MQRWLRILVLMLVAIPYAQLFSPISCVAQTAAGPMCCAQHAAVTAPSCCDAKADSFLSEDKTTLDVPQASVALRAVRQMPVEAGRIDKTGVEPRTAYNSILLPALILRT